MDTQRKEIFARLNRVFQQVFDDDKIEIFKEMTAADLEDWDSIMHITLVVATEKEFGFRLNAADIGNLKNVGEMVDIFFQKLTKE
jgi:acyl carrier protein